jgi:hypothetical protein
MGLLGGTAAGDAVGESFFEAGETLEVIVGSGSLDLYITSKTEKCATPKRTPKDAPRIPHVASAQGVHGHVAPWGILEQAIFTA